MWKSIEGFEDYEVSDEGEVRSNKFGKQRVLKQTLCKNCSYVSLRKDRIQYTKSVSRLVALAFIPNPDNLPEVDHKDCNPLNNRTNNLRWCSRNQNMYNCSKHITNKSGYKGVSFYKSTNKWVAQISNQSKKITIGYFNTPEDAYQAYCKKAEELRGDFTRV